MMHRVDFSPASRSAREVVMIRQIEPYRAGWITRADDQWHGPALLVFLELALAHSLDLEHSLVDLDHADRYLCRMQ
jgi:hypothetical protein